MQFSDWTVGGSIGAASLASDAQTDPAYCEYNLKTVRKRLNPTIEYNRQGKEKIWIVKASFH